MGYGVIEHEAFVSMRALLKVVRADEVEGQYEEKPVQAEVEFKVLNYEESDEDDGAYIGHQFRDWFPFKKDEKSGQVGIGSGSKLHNLIDAALGADAFRTEFDVDDLLGKQIRAQVIRSGKNQDGKYSRVKWDNISPPPRKKVKAGSGAEDDGGPDVDDLAGIEALDVTKDADNESAA
jgi:hypothetical protein